MEYVNSASEQQPVTAGASIPTPATSYTLPFEKNFARGFQTPSQDDVQAITASLEDPDRELLDLEAEIAQTTAKLNALKTRRAHLLRHTTQRHAYIAPSPVRQLPTEVLQLIFIGACTSCQRYEYETPLNISWVCWKWRQIALATPVLWTNIYFGGHKWYNTFKEYVKRSADLPLSIKIKVPYQKRPSEYDDDECEETFEYHTDIMDCVYRSTLRRWRQVELHLGIEDLRMLDSVADLWDLEREGPLVLLESVTLGIEECRSYERKELPLVFQMEHAPMLYDIDFVERRFREF